MVSDQLIQTGTHLPRAAFFLSWGRAEWTEGTSGWKRASGRGWEMTDGPMEWCQAGWSDSWNSLSICDWSEKDWPVRQLSYHLHYQEEQLPAATGEKHHAMARAGVERQSWTTNELKGHWYGDHSVNGCLGISLIFCILATAVVTFFHSAVWTVLSFPICGKTTLYSLERCFPLLWCLDRCHYLNTLH